MSRSSPLKMRVHLQYEYNEYVQNNSVHYILLTKSKDTLSHINFASFFIISATTKKVNVFDRYVCKQCETLTTMSILPPCSYITK